MLGPSKLHTFSICIVPFVLSMHLVGSSRGSLDQQAGIATSFSFPLGFADGHGYGPRVNYDSGQLIEDTGFDAQNPDLAQTTALGRPRRTKRDEATARGS
jgi:hypothetical protein